MQAHEQEIKDRVGTASLEDIAARAHAAVASALPAQLLKVPSHAHPEGGQPRLQGLAVSLTMLAQLCCCIMSGLQHRQDPAKQSMLCVCVCMCGVRALTSTCQDSLPGCCRGYAAGRTARGAQQRRAEAVQRLQQELPAHPRPALAAAGTPGRCHGGAVPLRGGSRAAACGVQERARPDGAPSHCASLHAGQRGGDGELPAVLC